MKKGTKLLGAGFSLLLLTSAVFLKLQANTLPNEHISRVELNIHTANQKAHESYVNTYGEPNATDKNYNADEHEKNYYNIFKDTIKLDADFKEQLATTPGITDVEKTNYQNIRLENGIATPREKEADMVYFDDENTMFILGVDNNKLLSLNMPADTDITGRRFTQEEIINGEPVVMISDETAQNNNLKVGDTANLLVDERATNGDIEKTNSFTAKIIGIYPKVQNGNMKADFTTSLEFLQTLNPKVSESAFPCIYYFETNDFAATSASLNQILPEVFEIY